MHTESHPQAGQIVTLSLKGEHPQGTLHSGDEFRIDDWWDKLTGGSWGDAVGNPAAIVYAFRAGFAGVDEEFRPVIPTDDEVLYGHSVATGMGHLVHVSELEVRS